MEEWRCQRCGDAMVSSVIPGDHICNACDELLEGFATLLELDETDAYQQVIGHG